VRVVSRFVIDPVVLDQNPGMAPFVETSARAEDVTSACAAVAAARELADVVVVGLHWGVPAGWAPSFQSELADYQQPLAHALIDAGADAIVGHHPHVLHGIEVYCGRPIFYSLGNFLFHILVSGELELVRPYPAYDFTSIRARLGGIARLHWSRPGPPERAELGIVALDETGEPRMAGPDEARPAVARVNALSARFGASVAGDGDWLAVHAP
jgi:poly-gamma-glutamate synthesis protein (capsule biosynthesis protein)